MFVPAPPASLPFPLRLEPSPPATAAVWGESVRAAEGGCKGRAEGTSAGTAPNKALNRTHPKIGSCQM